MNSEYILGLDIGTSSVRAALFDHGGQLLPETLARRVYDSDGTAEFDANVLLADVCSVVDETLELSAGTEGEVTHVASCAFWHSLVGVDEKGKPTTKVLTWVDTRSRECTDVLRKRFDEAEVHDRTGARFHSSFWPSKLLWLKQENKEVLDQTVKWLSFGDYVSMKLHAGNRIEKLIPPMYYNNKQWQFGGFPTTSVSMASATGIFDIRKCDWDEELMEFLGVRRFDLPLIIEDDQWRSLSRRYGKRWPRLKNTWWFPAIGDGAASNIGSGCVTRTRMGLTIGTSGAMRIAFEGGPPKNLPPGLWCYRVDRERIIVGGTLSDGGGLYHWLKESLRVDLSDEEIGAEMARRGSDAHGLTVMPFFFGERSTGYNENARGSIIGLTASHDAIDILQAAMEAVAFRFADILEQLETIAPIDEIVVSGGALDASPVWRQIIADVLGRDLLVSNAREASLHGAVLLALESIGKIKNLEDVSTVLNPKEFHPKCHKTYSARKRHAATYDKLLNPKK